MEILADILHSFEEFHAPRVQLAGLPIPESIRSRGESMETPAKRMIFLVEMIRVYIGDPSGSKLSSGGDFLQGQKHATGNR